MWKDILLVASGGSIGATLRFLAATLITRLYGGLFPLGTVLVNLSGSFAIGMLMTLFLQRTQLGVGWRLFFVTGVLGGYTTFSSFEWETFAALKNGAVMISFLNVLLSVILGFCGVFLGSLLTSRLSSR